MAFAMVLLGIAAVVALGLGAVGVYGVLSYVVSQRTGEIGVRMALGASAGDVRRLILGRGATVSLLGLGLGLVGAIALSRTLSSVLFEVRPTDPATYASVSVLLLLVALAASYVPARRASRQDPTEALRSE
jgi:ABC-type antimicrobial peptide transport system permease subunit